MANLLDFMPLIRENIDTIRARLDSDANAGLDPSDPDFKDTTVGGIFYDITQALGLEAERLWDLLSVEVPASMFPLFAWGTYLDQHGVTINLPRKAEVKATGEVTFTGDEGTLIATGTQVATIQTDPDAEPVVFATIESGTIPVGGSITLDVEAVVAGAEGNVASGAITVLLSPVAGIASITNTDATSGGADVESDDLYRQRILIEYAAPHGAGTIADYERWALGYAPVGYVTVEPLWNGAGTVRVIVTDQSNNPVSSTVEDGLQNLLDPVAGEGRGLAPIGAIVTVETPALLTVNVAATVTFESGYSLDGGSATVATRDAIEDAIRAYIDTLRPGEDVVRQEIASRIIAVQGVYDVDVTTPAGNTAVTSLQVARTGTITLT